MVSEDGYECWCVSKNPVGMCRWAHARNHVWWQLATHKISLEMCSWEDPANLLAYRRKICTFSCVAPKEGAWWNRRHCCRCSRAATLPAMGEKGDTNTFLRLNYTDGLGRKCRCYFWTSLFLFRKRFQMAFICNVCFLHPLSTLTCLMCGYHFRAYLRIHLLALTSGACFFKHFLWQEGGQFTQNMCLPCLFVCFCGLFQP